MLQHPIHFLSTAIPGSTSPDGGVCLPCSGVASGRAVSIPPNSHFQFISHFKSRCVSLSLTLSKYHTTSSSVCNATSSSSSYNRRNPDFSRQNKFSRNRNRNNDEKELGYDEELEESETLSSKNGSLLSANQKFQATLAPGPREKEIVELFRKVQTQLRERAAIKEERKVEESSSQANKSKENETVDSLLKLLKKHSVNQGKKNTVTADKRDDFLQVYSTSEVEDEIQESPPRTELTRPKSNFRRRSPVPEVKLQPEYSEGSDRKQIDLDVEADVEPLFVEGNTTFDERLEDESCEVYEDGQILVGGSDLSGMKLTELRTLAKSRGMKGFSKLKKKELMELLSEAV